MSIETLAQRFYDYSLHIRGYSKHTIRSYKHIINYYRKFACIERIEQVNEENVRSMFLDGRVDRKWAATTYKNFHKSLLVFFRWCVTEKYLQQNPAENIEIPKREKSLPVIINQQQALRLLETVYNYPYDLKFLRCRNHAIFAMFLFAGLRRSELLKLRFTDVDIDNRTIFVNLGKGSKDRIIPMSYTLAQILQKYLEARKGLNRTCCEFFTSSKSNRGLSNQGLRWLIPKIKKASGIKFTVHQLRHTFATLMLQGGCDIFSLSKMMGHSDIRTTTIYLTASAEHLRAQIIKHPLNDFSKVNACQL